jgi:Lipid A 3-O-deacylase (PagL)
MRAGLTLTFSVLITTIAFTQDHNNEPPLSCSQGSLQPSDYAVKSATDANAHPKSDDGRVATRCSLSTPTQNMVDSPMAHADSSYEPIKAPRVGELADFNRGVYYRNKLEFSLDAGYLPINIPFPLDIFVGDAYNTYPLQYTLVPIIASLRWHLDGIGGPWIFRGNFDLTFSGSVTAIPRGPETRYFSYDMGIRRNFVPHKSKVAPYFDVRLGVGNIDAKGPEGVPYAQGEDLTFTVNMGSGVRYNFSPRYAFSAGLNFMHISNLDLSEGNGKPSWGVRNYGINVYGPMIGLYIQLRRHDRQLE